MMRVNILNVTSQAASVNTRSQMIGRCENVAVQVITSNQSSANYAFKLQSSNDNSNWTDISGATATITADGADMINVSAAGYKWIRGVFTRTTGTADFVVNVSGTEVAEC